MSVQKVSFFSLASIVISAIIGSGAFNLPLEISCHSGLLGIVIGWLITGIGMIALALTFQKLSQLKPEFDGGIYFYAREGFGQFIGWNTAWGYWFSAFLGNIAYLLLLFDAFSYFFPTLNKLNSIYPLTFLSLLVWIVYHILLRGIKISSYINNITVLITLVSLSVFIIIMASNYKHTNMVENFWGEDTILYQVKNTMYATIWSFLGIEGAIVLSSRTDNKKLIGKATVVGLLLTLFFYIAVSLFAFAAVPREILINFKNPSVAYALEYVVGKWGATVINIALIFNLFGSLLSWTMLAAEIPYVASKDKVMPQFFTKINKYSAPSTSLFITTTNIQIFLIIAFFFSGTYNLLYTLSSVTILVPYFFTTAYLLKITVKNNTCPVYDFFIGAIGLIYVIWLIYAAGVYNLLLSTILYGFGIIFFIYTKFEKKILKFYY